jgi:hypothetical protein
LVCIIVSVQATLAQALEVRRFCFKQPRAEVVYRSIKDFLLPKDNTEVMGDCLEVAGTQERLDFIETLISKQFTYSRPDLAGDSAGVRHCQIEIEKNSNSNSNTRIVALGDDTDIRDKLKTAEGKEVSSLVLRPGKSGSFQYIDKQLQIICNLRAEKFELEFSFMHLRGGMSTSVVLSAGEKMNVASVVKDLNSKNRDISINSGLSNVETTGADQTEYFISVR